MPLTVKNKAGETAPFTLRKNGSVFWVEEPATGKVTFRIHSNGDLYANNSTYGWCVSNLTAGDIWNGYCLPVRLWLRSPRVEQ